MLYTDGAHIVADSLEELHAFADSVELGLHWYEGVRKGHPHYDIPKTRRSEILETPGLKHISSRELLPISKKLLL